MTKPADRADRLKKAMGPYLGRRYLVQFKSAPQRGCKGVLISRDEAYYTFDEVELKDEDTGGQFVAFDGQLLVSPSNVEYLVPYSPAVMVVE